MRYLQVLIHLFLLMVFFLQPLTAQEPQAPDIQSTTEEAETADIDDATLGTRLTRILSSIPTFENIAVAVTDGIVTLTGSVPNGTQRDEVVELVRGLEGVVYVVNNIELESDVNQAVSPVLERLRTYWDNFVALLPLIGIALVILALFWFVSLWVSRWGWLYQHLHVNPLLREFLRQIVRAGVFLVGLLIALDILGATPFVTAVLGTAGVAGLAVGFAFRDIMENYLAGILMSARQPFAQNDLVKVGTNEGKIVRLTARELVLLTLDGNQVRIPNATVFKSEIYNYSRNPLRRFDFVVGVGTSEDLSYVQQLGLETLRAMNGVLADPAPFSAITTLGDSNVLVQFFAWVNTRETDFLKAKSQGIRLVKEAFDEADITMPEPIQRVRLERAADKQASERDDSINTRQKNTEKRPLNLQEKTQEATSVDVSPDRALEKQMDEECARTDEENLLKPAKEKSA
jgi:small conductance mechanosensitive channel